MVCPGFDNTWRVDARVIWRGGGGKRGQGPRSRTALQKGRVFLPHFVLLIDHLFLHRLVEIYVGENAGEGEVGKDTARCTGWGVHRQEEKGGGQWVSKMVQR